MAMNWEATHGHTWRSGPPCEVALDGTILRARRGDTHWAIDLAAAGAVAELHHWGFARGSLLRIATGSMALTIAGEAYSSTELAYQAPLHECPDLVMRSVDFQQLLVALPMSLQAQGDGPHPFWLWDVKLQAPGAFMVLVTFGFVIAAGLSAKLMESVIGLWVPLLLGLVAGEIAIIRRHRRKLTSPVLRVTIDGERLTLLHADSDAVVGAWPLDTLGPRWLRWTQPASGPAYYAPFDYPQVILEGALPDPLRIGSPCLWAKTSGPKMGLPRYLVSPACWPRLAELLAARQATSAPLRAATAGEGNDHARALRGSGPRRRVHSR